MPRFLRLPPAQRTKKSALIFLSPASLGHDGGRAIDATTLAEFAAMNERCLLRRSN